MGSGCLPCSGTYAFVEPPQSPDAPILQACSHISVNTHTRRSSLLDGSLLQHLLENVLAPPWSKTKGTWNDFFYYPTHLKKRQVSVLPTPKLSLVAKIYTGLLHRRKLPQQKMRTSPLPIEVPLVDSSSSDDSAATSNAIPILAKHKGPRISLVNVAKSPENRVKSVCSSIREKLSL